MNFGELAKIVTLTYLAWLKETKGVVFQLGYHRGSTELANKAF